MAKEIGEVANTTLVRRMAESEINIRRDMDYISEMMLVFESKCRSIRRELVKAHEIAVELKLRVEGLEHREEVVSKMEL